MKEKILAGYIVNLEKSGIDKYLLGVLNVALENGIQMDFLSSNCNEKDEEYLKSLGCNVFKIHSLKSPLKQYRDIKKILKEGNYTKTYFNISEPMNLIGAKASHDSKVFTVVHSHSADIDISSPLKRGIKKLINYLCKPFLCRYTDKFLSCSYKAGYWLFPKKAVESDKFQIIYNAIDVSKFSTDRSKKDIVRENLGIEKDAMVIGHVGSYCYQKNNLFLPDILKETLKLNPNAMMILIGDGADREATELKFKSLGLENRVKFLGIRNDVNELLQAMDVFVLPSRFEGLPIVAVEAQLSGVPCVLSQNIDTLVKIHDKCLMASINSASDWAKAILTVAGSTEIEFDKVAVDNFTFESNKKRLLEIVLK